MTGRIVRRGAHALAVTAIIAVVAAPAAGSVEAPDREPGTRGAGSGSEPGRRFGILPFGEQGFPSWSRLLDRMPGPVITAPGTAEAPVTPVAKGHPAGTAKQRPEHRDAIRWSEGHADGRKMALALSAMGFSFGTTVNRNDIVAAGHELGVRFGPRIDSGELEEVRLRAWRYGGLRMAASGIDFVGLLDPYDIAQAAGRFGVAVGSQIDPGDIAAVIATGQERLSKQLRAGGFDHGQVVNTSDLRLAARVNGIQLGETLRPADARRVARAVAEHGKQDRTLRFARVGRVEFHLPGKQPAYVGFHQASDRRVLPMRRQGKPLSDFMSSRGRGTHRGGAVDIPMAPGAAVYAPVTGRVVEVRTYSLYGRYTDQRLRIVPDDDKRMLTTVLHVKGLKVRSGDRVVAGKTVIASSARKFPFWSQVDGYSGRPWGHVHIETRWR